MRYAVIRNHYSHGQHQYFRCFLITLCILVLSGISSADEIRFDFESGDLGGWHIVNGEFGTCITSRNGDKSGAQGIWYFNSSETATGGADNRFTGVAESPVFIPDSPDMSLRVGGGVHQSMYIALCSVDGGELAYARGKNTVLMQQVDWHIPDAVGKPVFLRIVDENSGGWGHITFDDFSAEGIIDKEHTRLRNADPDFPAMQRDLCKRLKEFTVSALKNAITDIHKAFPDIYTGEKFLNLLADFEAVHVKAEASLLSYDTAELRWADGIIDRFVAFRREVLAAHPLLTAHPLLYVVRNQYKPDHHNTATIFQAGEVNTASFTGGSALKIIDFAEGGNVRTLLEQPDGIIRDPELYFDGTQIIFSMRRSINDDYHIYEINTDGSELRQLTSAAGVSDIDPMYLSDGSIVFSSTREPKFCMCNKHIMCNLFRMEADGANIRQIGKSTLFEGHPSLMPDGRILYDRWEYIDRNFGDAQSLWTVNPDGTNHALYWGNNTNSPGGVIDARIIPGTQQAISVFGSCHDRPWGALAIIERRLGMDLRKPVVHMWPSDAVDLTGVGNYDTFKSVELKYEDPYPLSDTYFLCSRMTGDGEQMGIYIIDTFGNQVLLHTEDGGCYDPMPVSRRARPDMIPSRRNYDNEDGFMYVIDVYEGTHMKGIEPGSVKYLRVVESPEKRTWNYHAWGGQGTLWPAMNWHDFNNKRILGTVPVEEDGSAYFRIPSDTFVYFQLLDGQGMMIQSMRSGTMVQSGETTGCIGCHDNRRTAPPVAVSETPKAVTREPDSLDGWYGAPRLFSYKKEVQPVLDRSCTSCHDYGKPAGNRLNLSGDRTDTFNTSYNELWRKEYIAAIGGGPSDIQEAYSWGSSQSRLVEVLQSGHQGVRLDTESLDRIITWIDINAPYYPVYMTAYPGNLAGRSPLSPEQLSRLTELTGIQFARLASYNRNQGPMINFDRPELSPCLDTIPDNESDSYAGALSIIKSGSALLALRPRADMGGFSACMIDQLRDDKYEARRAIELANRKAIRDGVERYDTPGRNAEER